jgi:cytochrome c oxidase subunit 3
MTIKRNHTFHIVDQSPWPIIAALGALTITTGLVKWFNIFNFGLTVVGLLSLTLTSYQWWRDVSRESTFQGLHTSKVIGGLKWGIILFITSEVLFFFSFFWAFFHRSLSPNIEVGLFWPPSGVYPFNPFNVPLLNTLILVSSGVTVTWAHHSLIEKNLSQFINRIILTITLGVYFTALQVYEYFEASFSISDSIYGSTFFVATGFHGLHVLIGSSFLLICLIRGAKFHFSPSHHFGFEAAAWYWHFVDVVWLFLYINVYWWGL